MSQTQDEAIICSNPECSWNEDNKCINGLNPPQQCTTRSIVLTYDLLSQDSEIEFDNADEIHAAETVKLQWGDTFTDENLHRLTYRYSCQFILVVGEPSSGKSTLYAALFDSFQKGMCGRYSFHSTRTPIGFERTCHLAREKSGGRIPRTERTKSYEFSYYHLAVKEMPGIAPVSHLLFADVNGERYQQAREKDEEMKQLTAFSKADHIFFVADGGLLIDPAARHTVKDDVMKMIARALQNNMISENQQMHLVITKWDKIVSAGSTDSIQNFLIAPIQARFQGIDKILKIASRSMNDAVPARSGISEFLETCVVRRQQSQVLQTPTIERQFQDFKYGRRER